MDSIPCLKQRLSSDNRYPRPTTRPHPDCFVFDVAIFKATGSLGARPGRNGRCWAWMLPQEGRSDLWPRFLLDRLWGFLWDSPRPFCWSAHLGWGQTSKLRGTSAGRLGDLRRPQDRHLPPAPPGPGSRRGRTVGPNKTMVCISSALPFTEGER